MATQVRGEAMTYLLFASLMTDKSLEINKNSGNTSEIYTYIYIYYFFLLYTHVCPGTDCID